MEPMRETVWQQIFAAHPMIHAMTNPVTMNTVVNGILAAGGTAICASAPEEATEITAECQGLLLNIGMPDESRRRAMLLSGKKANELGIPVVLDPVGAGASSYRDRILRELLSEVHMSCIRGNQSEMAALYGLHFQSRGVESSGTVLSEEEMQKLAARYDTILAVTGETDYAVSPEGVLRSNTGTSLEKKVTGSGCLLSGLTCALLSAEHFSQEKERDLIHELLSSYGTCAAEAEQELRSEGNHTSRGTASFLTALIDRISRESGVWAE